MSTPSRHSQASFAVKIHPPKKVVPNIGYMDPPGVAVAMAILTNTRTSITWHGGLGKLQRQGHAMNTKRALHGVPEYRILPMSDEAAAFLYLNDKD